MATPSEIPPITHRLALVCALAMSASVFASDASSSVGGLDDSAAAHPEATHPEDLLGQQASLLDRVGYVLAMVDGMNLKFDLVYRGVIDKRFPKGALLNNPFAMISEIFGRALAQIKSERGTGSLGPNGDSLIFAIADARQKSDRVANLMRQVAGEPNPFQSSIDRKGLVAMARLAQEANASCGS